MNTIRFFSLTTAVCRKYIKDYNLWQAFVNKPNFQIACPAIRNASIENNFPRKQRIQLQELSLQLSVETQGGAHIRCGKTLSYSPKRSPSESESCSPYVCVLSDRSSQDRKPLLLCFSFRLFRATTTCLFLSMLMSPFSHLRVSWQVSSTQLKRFVRVLRPQGSEFRTRQVLNRDCAVLTCR